MASKGHRLHIQSTVDKKNALKLTISAKNFQYASECVETFCKVSATFPRTIHFFPKILAISEEKEAADCAAINKNLNKVRVANQMPLN